MRQYRTAQSGSTHRTLVIEVLHHWLAATVIPKPLTTAIPATHMPRPLRKLASLGTFRRTKPSPPANHAQPARTRRRAAVPVTASANVSPPSVEAAVTRRKRLHHRPFSWRPRCGFLVFSYSRSGRVLHLADAERQHDVPEAVDERVGGYPGDKEGGTAPVVAGGPEAEDD